MQGLAINTSVLRVNVNDNKFDDEGATAMAAALAMNK